MFAVPIAVQGRPFGVLELYRQTPGALSPVEHEAALACALALGRAVLAAHQEESDAFDHTANPEGTRTQTEQILDGQFFAANEFTRSEVYVAAGMVSVQLEVSAEEGLERLRAHAYSAGRSIVEIAADVVARRLSLQSERDEENDEAP